jgi:hypothetical protein
MFGGVILFKKILSAFICLAIVITPTVLVTKVEASGIGFSPYWMYTDSVVIGMTYDNGIVSWNGNITGTSNCKSITATYILYKKDSQGVYQVVQNPSAFSSNSRQLYSSGSYNGGAGQYKIKVTAAIKSTSNATENITEYDEQTFS